MKSHPGVTGERVLPLPPPHLHPCHRRYRQAQTPLRTGNTRQLTESPAPRASRAAPPSSASGAGNVNSVNESRPAQLAGNVNNGNASRADSFARRPPIPPRTAASRGTQAQVRLSPFVAVKESFYSP